MNNLMAEMARYGVSNADIQAVLSCTDKTAKSKVTGNSEFSISEAFKVRDAFFPGMRIEYLFAHTKESV